MRLKHPVYPVYPVNVLISDNAYHFFSRKLLTNFFDDVLFNQLVG